MADPRRLRRTTAALDALRRRARAHEGSHEHDGLPSGSGRRLRAQHHEPRRRGGPRERVAAQVAGAMTDHGVHAVLVVDAGAPAGGATSRALTARLLEFSPSVPAIDAVTEMPTAILPSAPIADAIRTLAAPGVTHLLVTTGPAAVPQGVVSGSDIVRYAASRG